MGTIGRIGRIGRIGIDGIDGKFPSSAALPSLPSSFSASQQTKRSATQWQTFYVYCMLFYSVDFDSTATSRLTFDTKP